MLGWGKAAGLDRPGTGGVTMSGDAGSGAVRELLVVFAVAGAGLLLAMVAAFAPWHPTPRGVAPAGLVELHSPAGPAAEPASTATVG